MTAVSPRNKTLRKYRELLISLSTTPISRVSLKKELTLSDREIREAKNYWRSHGIEIQVCFTERKAFYYVSKKDWPHVKTVAAEAWRELKKKDSPVSHNENSISIFYQVLRFILESPASKEAVVSGLGITATQLRRAVDYWRMRGIRFKRLYKNGMVHYFVGLDDYSVAKAILFEREKHV